MTDSDNVSPDCRVGQWLTCDLYDSQGVNDPIRGWMSENLSDGGKWRKCLQEPQASPVVSYLQIQWPGWLKIFLDVSSVLISINQFFSMFIVPVKKLVPSYNFDLKRKS